MARLVGKNHYANTTIYYYSDGSGHVKHYKGGKMIDKFYSSERGQVIFMKDKVDGTIKSAIRSDLKELIKSGIVHPH